MLVNLVLTCIQNAWIYVTVMEVWFGPSTSSCHVFLLSVAFEMHIPVLSSSMFVLLFNVWTLSAKDFTVVSAFKSPN